MTHETPNPPADDVGYRGELTGEEIDAITDQVPCWFGWMAVAGRSGEMFTAELRRATPRGPDTILCGAHPSERAAWEACVSRIRMMIAAAASNDPARMAVVRASIVYAPRATDKEWDDLRDFYRRVREHCEFRLPVNRGDL